MADIDLTYLNEISGGDKEFIDEMINTFLEETPKDLEDMKLKMDASDWTEVGKIAHKLKSSIKLFGMNNLREEVLEIEQNGKNGTDTDALPSKVNSFLDNCAQAIEDLRKYL